MLGKKQRIPKTVSFKGVGTVSSQAFLLKVKDNDTGVLRAAVVVSKKVDKRAVLRNKIKRQVRSFIQNYLPDITKGKDVLIIARENARDKTDKEIFEILENTFKKIKLIK